jgi:hypothetical protein
MNMDINGGNETIENMNFCEKTTWDGGGAGWGRGRYTVSPLLLVHCIIF